MKKHKKQLKKAHKKIKQVFFTFFIELILSRFKSNRVLGFRAKFKTKNHAKKKIHIDVVSNNIQLNKKNISLYQLHCEVLTEKTDLETLRLKLNDKIIIKSFRHSHNANSTFVYFQLPKTAITGFSYSFELYCGKTQTTFATGYYIDNLLAEHNHQLSAAQQQLCLGNQVGALQLAKTALPRQYRQDRPLSLKSNIAYSSGKSPLIDVIVPVYDGLTETQNCINSILNSKNQSQFRLIIIYDCGPNPSLLTWLKTLPISDRLQLIINPINKGFVGSVNLGMSMSEHNDVILLNADAVVNANWIDRLTSAAYQTNNIATVSPFSNNASILSYPHFCQENDLPSHLTLEQLDNYFAKINDTALVDLPTAHGFCCYLRRTALNEIGLFDEALWGKGYAEENDFSIKAQRLGWRTVLATNVFVEHLGSVSFAGLAQQKINKQLAKLNILYPDYHYIVHHFMVHDPILPYRNNVSLKIILDTYKQQAIDIAPCILMITHRLGGGTEVNVKNLTDRLLTEKVNVLTLRPTTFEKLTLTDAGTGLSMNWHETDTVSIANQLKSFNLKLVHVHHVIGFDQNILELIDQLALPYDVTLHDFYSICPRVNMADFTYRFCDTQSLDNCNTCLKTNNAHSENRLLLSNVDAIENWRSLWEDFLNKARFVYTPSQDTFNHINQWLKLNNLSVKPHPDDYDAYINFVPHNSTIRVAVPGAISDIKGFNILKGCASYTDKNQLPLEFIVIGYTKNNKQLQQYKNVKITGHYEAHDFDHLIKYHRCDVAAFFSQWPETYSYTLSESIKAGLPVISFDVGAQAERIKDLGVGSVIALDSDIKTICNELIELAREPIQKNITMPYDYTSIYRDFYNLKYINEKNLVAEQSQCE